MASLLQNLIKKQSSKLITATLVKPPLPNLIPPLLTHLHHDPTITNFTPFKTGDSIPPDATPIFPSFPFGLCLNPIYSTGFVPSDADGVVSDEGLWADSVKKKRKKKMNKHKLKKLRKRLRKRT
ncbi:uncharacterized protein LOC131298128 [Rhododendron vialii]|uniref:uncharacterized protein LOC131298128 n=1 Tax=Rhododendron vialii TaxID=182163 RepID=UPI0026604A1C|nr:uncharacterized protein LOC131298128 [Rhododendron vialii]